MNSFIFKIPPNLSPFGDRPLLKGGITPLWQRGVRGDLIINVDYTAGQIT